MTTRWLAAQTVLPFSALDSPVTPVVRVLPITHTPPSDPAVRPLDTDSGYHGPLPPALFEKVKCRFVGLARSQRGDPAWFLKELFPQAK